MPARFRLCAFFVLQQFLSGNQYFLSMSTDGRIVFQSDKNGDENIYLFNPAADSVVALIADTVSEQHPIWVSGKDAVVYDAGHGKESRFFYLDLKTGKSCLLLRRQIACRQAAFTPSRHLTSASPAGRAEHR